MTARQLLSILRLSQALARIRFLEGVTSEEVDEVKVPLTLLVHVHNSIRLTLSRPIVDSDSFPLGYANYRVPAMGGVASDRIARKDRSVISLDRYPTHNRGTISAAGLVHHLICMP